MKTHLPLLAAALALAACTSADKTTDDGENDDPPPTSLARTVLDLPPPGSLGSAAEGYAAYDASIDTTSICAGAVLRPGPQAFADYLAPFGIVAKTYPSCQTGFHPRGQALDVYLYGDDAKQAFADWLTANTGEMARRLGIVQVIWQDQMWRSYYGGGGKPQGQWGDYFGDAHVDHVHVSFGEAGAEGATSFFVEVIGGGGGGPVASTSTFTECGVLHVGQMIGTDRPLPSCDGRYLLAQQTDGNLVLYRADGTPLWSSGTYGTVGNQTIMQGDGNLVLYTPNANPLWASWTYGYDGAELYVQTDGNVVIYLAGTPLWWTGTYE